MKKFTLVIAMLILQSFTIVEASGFEYMLDVMEIPKTNQNGYRINEEIYQKYQLFVYGNPEMITSRSKMEKC